MLKNTVVSGFKITFAMTLKLTQSKTNIFFAGTFYVPTTYEELKVVVTETVANNESGLDDDVNTLKVGICELNPKLDYLIQLLEGREHQKEEEQTNVTINFSDTNVKPTVGKKVSYKGSKRDTATSPRHSEHARKSAATSMTSRDADPPRLKSDSTTSNFGMWGSFGGCRNPILEVKIWFQNRRMKWKRSKKAQQEAKNTKDSDKSHSPVSTNTHNKNCAAQEPCTSTQAHSRAASPRKGANDGEQLYRPYVV